MRVRWGERGGGEEGAAAKQSGCRDGGKRNLAGGPNQVWLPPLPASPSASLSLSTCCQPNHSLNLKIDGGLFDFLFSRRAQRENSSAAGRQAVRQAGMDAEAERRGTVCDTSPSSAAADYFVYPASVLLTNSWRRSKCFRLFRGLQLHYPVSNQLGYWSDRSV